MIRALYPGCLESIKASVHLVLGGSAALCLLYNGLAFCVRREKHLAVNTVLYAAIVAIEVQQVGHHLKRLP